MKCSLLPGGGLALVLMLWGATAGAQTRTRSLREGAGAHPGPSVEGRKEATPYESVPRSGSASAPAPAAPGEEGTLSLGEPAPAGHDGYRGVAPGAKVEPPHAPRAKTPVRLTWTGFQMRPEGGSRVFIQLTREAPYQVMEAPGGLRVTLRGVRLHLRNNGRALDTHFFSTPVKAIKVSQKRGEVTLDIQTHGRPAHSERLEAQGGYQFLMIEFPTDGTATAEPTTTK